MVVRELFAKLGLDVDAQSFAKGELAAHGVEKALHLVGEAVVRAAEGFIHIIEQSITAGAELYNMSQRTGLSTDSLQQLKYAAMQTGVSFESMVQGVKLLQRNMYSAEQGNTSMAGTFTDLGINIHDSKGKLKDVDVVIGEMAKKFPHLSSASARTAIAMKLMGRGGQAFVSMLKEGEGGIGDFIERFKELGGGMSKETIANLKKTEDLLNDLQVVFKSIAATVTVALLPYIQGFIRETVKWFQVNRVLIKQRLANVMDALGVALGAAWQMARPFVKLLGMLADQGWLAKAATVALGLAMTVSLGTAAIKGIAALSKLAVGFRALATAEGLAALIPAAMALIYGALIILIALAAEDLYQFATGGESAIGDLIETTKKFWDSLMDPAKKGDSDFELFIKSVGELMTKHWTTVFSDTVEFWWQEIVGLFKRVAPMAKEALSGVGAGLLDFATGGLVKPEMLKGLASDAAFLWNGGASSPAASAAASPAMSTSQSSSETRNYTPINIDARGMDPAALRPVVEGAVRDALDTSHREAHAAVSR